MPGRVVEWEWHHGGGERSLVRFEVVPRPPGALLVLDHRLLDEASAPGYGAGWQGHLDALDALLRDAATVDVHGRFDSLRPAWVEQQAELGRGLGILRPDGEARALSYERRLDAPPERVWRALTDRLELGRWLTDVTIEPRVGGGVLIDWGEAGSNEGTVLAWEPPRALEFSWIWPGVHDSVLRFDLRPDGDGTHLRLEHRALSPSVAGDHGSGWHAYLDALADAVEGREVGSWDERELALRPHYEGRAAALA